MESDLPEVCDAHCHLIDYFDAAEVDDVIEKAEKAGVKQIIENATSHKTFLKVIEIYKRHPLVVVPSIGYHPYYLADLKQDWEAE